MLSLKWQTILAFSLLCGILVIPAIKIWCSKPLVFGHPIAARKSFPTRGQWLCAAGASSLKALRDFLILLLFILAIGFGVVLIATDGMPLDPRIS